MFSSHSQPQGSCWNIQEKWCRKNVGQFTKNCRTLTRNVIKLLKIQVWDPEKTYPGSLILGLEGTRSAQLWVVFMKLLLKCLLRRTYRVGRVLSFFSLVGGIGTLNNPRFWGRAHSNEGTCAVLLFICTYFVGGSVADPDPPVRGIDPDLDPSITKQKKHGWR